MSLPGAISPASMSARVGDSFFLNSATIGVPGQIAEDIPSGLKRWFGRVGYLLYGLVKFLRMEPFTVRIARTGQADVVEKVVEVRIGNGSFIGGLKVVGNADPESRDVVIQLIRGRYRAALAGAWAHNLAGWQQPKGRVREIRATAFSIACTPRTAGDGRWRNRHPHAGAGHGGARRAGGCGAQGFGAGHARRGVSLRVPAVPA